MRVFVATFYSWDDDYKHRDGLGEDVKAVFTSEEQANLWINEMVYEEIYDRTYQEQYEDENTIPKIPKHIMDVINHHNTHKTLIPQKKIDEWFEPQFIPHKYSYAVEEFEIE